MHTVNNYIDFVQLHHGEKLSDSIKRALLGSYEF